MLSMMTYIQRVSVRETLNLEYHAPGNLDRAHPNFSYTQQWD
jgi:hypothetical protein